MTVCRWFSITWRKSFYCAPEVRAVTSVSVCTNTIHFLRFWLWTSLFISWFEKLAITVLILPCGISLPANALMAFLKVFSAWWTFIGFCCFFILVQSRHWNLLSQLCGSWWNFFVVLYVMRSQVMDRTIDKCSQPKAYSVCPSMLIAMLELARLMPGGLLQESVTLVLSFSLSTTWLERSISLAIMFPLVSFGSFGCHSGLWALKSSTIMQSYNSISLLIDVLYPASQPDEGDM